MQYDTVEERLAQAFESSDLAHSDNRLKDVDFLTALGIAGASSGYSAIVRLNLALDGASIHEALRETRALTGRMARKRGWVLNSRKLHRVAVLALDLHIRPACPVCHGTKYQGVEVGCVGVPKPCAKCGATGLRKLHGALSSEANAVAAMLGNLTYETVERVRKLMW